MGKAFLTPQDLDPASTDSGFGFSPVLRAASAARTGSITGVVRAANGSVQPDVSLRLYLGNPAQPQNTWSNLQTARTDAQGAFKFSYVTRSSHWASVPAQAGKTYIVAADPPPGLGLGRSVVPNLTVVAGGETKLIMIVP